MGDGMCPQACSPRSRAPTASTHAAYVLPASRMRRATGAAVLAMPTVLRAQDRTLKVGAYGGYFKDSFDKNVFPEFTKATGIAVESVAEPTGEAWLVQLQQAATAGEAPADVSMISQTSMLKGQATELWAPLDPAKIKNVDGLIPAFVNKYPDGRVAELYKGIARQVAIAIAEKQKDMSHKFPNIVVQNT